MRLGSALAIPPFWRPAGFGIVSAGSLLSPFALTRAQVAGVQSSALGADGATLDLYAADVARFTGTAQRLLIEGQRTNLLVGQDTLSTQNVTVTAVAHVLSFYGTGSIALSGASTGTINGSGASTRTISTFTPTAGTLTLTVSGTVTNAQLEVGAFESSFVRSDSGQATRGMDFVSASLSSLNIGGNGACTVLWSGRFNALPNATLIQADDGTNNNRNLLDVLSTGVVRVGRANAAATAFATAASGVTAGADYRIGLTADGAGRVAASVDGAAVVSVTGAATSGLTTLRLGNNAPGGTPMFGETAQFRMLPYALSDADLQAAVAALPA